MSEESDEIPKKGGKKMLVLGLVAFNLLAAVGVGFFVMTGSEEEEVEEAEEGEEEEESKSSGDQEYGPLVEMKPLISNLDDPQAGRYVKITLHLEIKNEDVRPKVETALVPIRNELLVYFTGVKVEDTIGSKNKKRIIDDVSDLVDGVVGHGLVRRVFFTEFVTQ